MTAEGERLQVVARWFAVARILAVPLALAEVASATFPPGYAAWAWTTCGIFGAGALVLLGVSLPHFDVKPRRRLAEAALVFDTGVTFAFILLFSFKGGQPLSALYFVPVIEAALRFGVPGALIASAATGPALAGAEWFRSERFGSTDYHAATVGVRIGLGLALGLVVGRLAELLISAGRRADARAAEAERLRDELGRRVDLLEAANRCARALGSSLVMEEAFAAFIRELRGLVPFDRVAIVLEDGSAMRVIAASGLGVDEWLPPGSVLPQGALVEEVITSARTVYRRDMTDQLHPEETDLLAAGLRCRIVSPLLIGARATGMLAVLRSEPDSFEPDEIELVTLLGRLVGTAVQNIRAYGAEHRTVAELRRLSALRADFVSLVSHELRSPMATVMGSARTLQARWRELSPDQRESFLALIGDETARLADLIGDVLDTSRIEAGTFSYAFSDVGLADLVEETVAAAAVGQDEIGVRCNVRGSLPHLRGDRERLRQVLANLIDNAVKYSPAGGDVVVNAYAVDGRVRIDVADSGPGIPLDDQGMIFEKFGRSNSGQSKPGTGLGLFIARSIAEAHGGSLSVRSVPRQGAVFTLELPAAAG
jgi:signal transduction histidine kinase